MDKLFTDDIVIFNNTSEDLLNNSTNYKGKIAVLDRYCRWDKKSKRLEPNIRDFYFFEEEEFCTVVYQIKQYESSLESKDENTYKSYIIEYEDILRFEINKEGEHKIRSIEINKKNIFENAI